MHWRRLTAMLTAAAFLAVACSGNDDLLEPRAATSDTTAGRTDPLGDCGRPVDGPGLSRAGTPGPIVYQEADGQGLVVVGPDGRQLGRIDAPPLTRGYPVGTNKALYEQAGGGLVLIDTAQLTATRLPGPVRQLTGPYNSDGGRQFLPLTNFAGEGGEIVAMDAATATDISDIVGSGGPLEGIHLDDAEQNMAVFTAHGVWLTDTNFLEEATQLDAGATDEGDITADGCAVAYFRGDKDTGSLDVAVAHVGEGAGELGKTVATVRAADALFTELKWVGRRLVVCDDSGAILIDVTTGATQQFGEGRCTDIVRDLHRAEALVNVGDTVDTHWFHVGAAGDPEPLPELDGYNAAAVSTSDLVPLERGLGEPFLVYSFADHALHRTDRLPAATSASFDDLVPGAVLHVETQSDTATATQTALAIDLRDGKVHTVASAPGTSLGLPVAAPDGSAVVNTIGATLSIVPMPVTQAQPIPLGEGSIPVWTVSAFGGESGGGNPT